MDEYIKRQDAVDAILGEHPESHYPSWYAELIRNIPAANVVSSRLLEQIKCERDIAIEKAEKRWIPVTERLPGQDEIVLAYCKGNEGTVREFQIMRGWNLPFHATHWMPVPFRPFG